MPTITSTGVGSGLDVGSIVSGLMSAEQRPLNLLQQREATDKAQVSAFGKLQSQLASLGDLAGQLSAASAWSPMAAASTDAATVSASATAKAAVGTHTIEVQQLAQAQVLASGPFAASTTTVGTGTLVLELGTTAGGVFTPRSGGTPVTIPIDAGKQSLAGIRDAINAAGAGVSASIVNDAAGARLVLRGPTGADSSVRLRVTDDDGATDGAGLSALAWDPAAPAGAGANLKQTQEARDAKFSVDGVALASATNTADKVLDGVTLTLAKVTTAPLQLTVSVQTSALARNVNDFVSAWNGLNTLLRSQTLAAPDGGSAGPLQGDFTANTLLNGLRTMLLGSVAGMDGVNSLSAAGISLQRDGSLKVDSTRLNAAMDKPEQLGRLFGQPQAGSDPATRGFGVRFKDWASGLAGTAGVLSGRVEGLNRSIKSTQTREEKEQDRLDRLEAKLRKQYQALDSQMSALNARLAQMKSSLGLT